MSVLNWIWRVILALVVASFITTIYYMTHNVDMDVILPTVNVITVAGTALLGVIWTASRRYWYVLIMVVLLGLLRGLFNDELLTDFQSTWVIVAGGFVVFMLLVVLMMRVLKHDRARRAAAAAAEAAEAAAHPKPGETAVAATPVERAPAVAQPAPPPVPLPSAAEVEAAASATAAKVEASAEAIAEAAAVEASARD